jgi:C-terminal processing protease CtpA/Prc
MPIDDSQTERPRVRLSFDAADPTVDSIMCYSRPEYIYASAYIPDRSQKIGVIFGNREGGGVYIKRIAESSPFLNCNLQVGDHVMAINNVLCSSIKANRVIALIHSTSKCNMVSICVHNEKGDPETVSCSVQKAHPQAKVGVTLQTRRGAVRVNRVDRDGLFSNSLLMPHHRCMIINGVSCSHMTSKHAADLIKSLSDRVTIVSRPQEYYAMTLAFSKKTKWWRRFSSRAGTPVKAFALSACAA